MSDAKAAAPVGLLLAGGRGSRFDSTGHRDKLLALVDGQAVCLHAARALRQVCERSFAVLPPDKPDLLNILEQAGLEAIVTPATRLGMGHSIARGAGHILSRCGDCAVVVALGDMPRVRESTYRALMMQLGPDPLAIVAPSYRDRRGHPVVFGKAHLKTLAQLEGDRGAFAILERYPPRLIAVDDPGVLQDIDTPEDLAADAAHDSMDRRRDTPDFHRR